MAITSGLANSQSTSNIMRRPTDPLKVEATTKAKSDLLLTAKQMSQQKKTKMKTKMKVDSAASMLQADTPDPKTSIEGYLRIGKRQYA
jgi:hypothetical protein